MTTKRVAILAFLTVFGLALPTFAQQSKTVTKGPEVIKRIQTRHWTAASRNRTPVS